MKKINIKIWLIVAAFILVGIIRVEAFVLKDHDYKEIKGGSGELHDFSKANILEGGSLLNARIYNKSTLNIMGGKVSGLPSGFGVCAHDNSKVNIVCGRISTTLRSYDKSTVDVAGGKVWSLYSYDSGKVDVSGGKIELLIAQNLLHNGPERVNISGGNIGVFGAGIDLNGSEQLRITDDLSLSDLTCYGVQVADGMVNKFEFSSLSAYDNSSVIMSCGEIGRHRRHRFAFIPHNNGLYANDSSSVDIDGGTVRNIRAYDNSNVKISNGTIHHIHTYNSNFLGISGGNIDRLHAYNLRFDSRPDRVNISGGNVGTFRAGIDLRGSEQLRITDDFSLLDLTSYGVHAADGTISNVEFFLYPFDSSSVNISGGKARVGTSDSSTVNIDGGEARVDAEDDSIINISGGKVLVAYSRGKSYLEISGGKADWISSHDNSVVDISGGAVEYIDAYGNTDINISGGKVGVVNAQLSSRVQITGGSVSEIIATPNSNFRIYGDDFELGEGLYFDDDGKTILGTGKLTGKSFENVKFTILIKGNTQAAIKAISESE